jgi:hypothetical protein
VTEATKEDLATFAGILEEFAVAQRQAALGETRKQRLTVSRHVGDMNIAYDMVVDEGSTSADIFSILAPLDSAIDRLKAKADLSDCYVQMANHVGQIEMSMKKMLAERDEYRKANAERNERRREPIGLTSTQSANLSAHRVSIDDCFARIEELKRAAAECRRVLGGEDPFAVLDEQITKRLDLLRGARQDAA